MFHKQQRKIIWVIKMSMNSCRLTMHRAYVCSLLWLFSLKKVILPLYCEIRRVHTNGNGNLIRQSATFKNKRHQNTPINTAPFLHIISPPKMCFLCVNCIHIIFLLFQSFACRWVSGAKVFHSKNPYLDWSY